jgi:hypothetical protein
VRVISPKTRRAEAANSTPALRLAETSSTLSTLHHREDVVGIHDQVFFPLNLYLRTGIFGQDHYVPGAHLHFVGDSYRDDLSRLRLLPGRVGQHYPASRLLLALDPLDERPHPKRL